MSPSRRWCHISIVPGVSESARCSHQRWTRGHAADQSDDSRAEGDLELLLRADRRLSTANFHRNLNTRSAAPHRAAAAQLIGAAAVEIREEVTQPLVSVSELLDT